MDPIYIYIYIYPCRGPEHCPHMESCTHPQYSPAFHNIDCSSCKDLYRRRTEAHGASVKQVCRDGAGLIFLAQRLCFVCSFPARKSLKAITIEVHSPENDTG